MLVTSIFSWSFLGVSLALCSVLLNQYQTHPDFTIAEVFGGSLLASLALSTVVTTFARRHAYARMMQRMTLGPTSFTRLSRTSSSFVSLCRRMGIYNVSLREATRGGAFSISLRGRGVVAIAPEMAASLSTEETEAVLAHELSHIKNGDSAAKGIARLARMAFPFDPVLRLVEAAVHRERELWADRVSAEFTRNPLALASALVKVNTAVFKGSSAHAAGFFVGGNGHGIFSPYPSLERRVDALLLLARRMEFVSIVLVSA
jgi:Zn-dependent protease with chaperone function